jgi:hypothetical protein
MSESFPDPEGRWLINHAEVERLIDETLGFPSLESILAASARVDRALARGVPDHVDLVRLSLEVA